MPIQIVRNDITKMYVNAIVNAANSKLIRGGGVCGAIHQAAGPMLEAECVKLGGCRTGEAKITGAYNLPCRYVIHTVGPVWHGGLSGEKKLLTSCYRESLRLAQEHGCRSVAFPLISSGIFGYPKEQALKAAMDAISAFLLGSDSDMDVYLVVFGKESFAISQKLASDVKQFIDDQYTAHVAEERVRRSSIAQNHGHFDDFCPMPACSDMAFGDAECEASFGGDFYSFGEDFYSFDSLEEALEQIDESFSQMVLRKIKEKGMKNADCYKKANLGRQHFSKISNDIHYKPKKQTALAIAVALELSYEETRELLEKAGLAFSHSDKFDIIVEYFIRKKKYDIFEINEVLFYYDQVLLGAAVL